MKAFSHKKDFTTVKFLAAVTVFFLSLFAAKLSGAQTMVSTSPMNKNFLIERGTGHVCGSCPHITLRCDTVIDSHPGRGMLIEYHFGPDAVPQAHPLETDYRTAYGDSILSWPFYLNMMVNRRDQGIPYGSTFIFSPTDNQVKNEADLVVTQPSCINLAMSSGFDTTTRLLTVNVEAYYTANSETPLNYLQIAITEDSLISTQYDGDYPYNNHFNDTFNHMNVFRANMNGFWGDTVTTTTTGTLIARTYTVTLPTTPYKWNYKHCKLTLYATEDKAASGVQSFAGKVITAIRTDIGNTVTAIAENSPVSENEMVFPNPTCGMINIKKNSLGNDRVEVIDLLGKIVFTATDLNAQLRTIDLSSAENGIYFVKVYSENGVSIHKILLQK